MCGGGPDQIEPGNGFPRPFGPDGKQALRDQPFGDMLPAKGKAFASNGG